MFKFVNKKKIAGIFAAFIGLVAVVGASVSSAFAYRPSYDEYRIGSVSSGILCCQGEASLDVKKLKLTFDVPSMPQADDYTDVNYRSKVTSEYTLYNPWDETVTARLVVPEMQKPNYFGNNPDVTPVVTVNGEKVQTEVRHSAIEYYGKGGVELSDEWYSDAFFNPELPVHTYKINAGANLSYAYLKGDIITDYTKARYIADESDEFSCRYSKDGENIFYILGDDSTVNFDALSFYDYNRYELERISDLFTLEKVETITLAELVLRSVRPVDGVSDLDWYNGMLAGFSNGECVCSKFDLTVNNLKKYYQYTVEIAPKGELVTSVTFPVYPDIYSSDKCDYYYNMSSAVCWGGFGKIEVEINTAFYISETAKDFQKTDTGYKTVYSVAPYGTIFFSLNRNYSGNSGSSVSSSSKTPVALVIFLVSLLVRVVIFVIGGGISFIVLMVKKSKQSQ